MQLDKEHIMKAEPWIVPEAIEFLKRTVISPEMHVLETGAGGSTIFFAKYCAHVITYEHKKKWIKIVKDELEALGLDHKVQLIHDPDYPLLGLIRHPAKFFDLIFIDGRGRVKSIKTCFSQLRMNGWIILDNSDRKKYSEAVDLLDSLLMTRKDFVKDWKTSFWHKI